MKIKQKLEVRTEYMKFETFSLKCHFRFKMAKFLSHNCLFGEMSDFEIFSCFNNFHDICQNVLFQHFIDLLKKLNVFGQKVQ